MRTMKNHQCLPFQSETYISIMNVSLLFVTKATVFQKERSSPWWYQLSSCSHFMMCEKDVNWSPFIMDEWFWFMFITFWHSKWRYWAKNPGTTIILLQISVSKTLQNEDAYLVMLISKQEIELQCYLFPSWFSSLERYRYHVLINFFHSNLVRIKNESAT